MTIKTYLDKFPFISINRGMLPDQAVEFGKILLASDFSIIETPLNSPNPFDTIQRMASEFGSDALIGAGTVTTINQVDQVKNAGGNLIVSPNCNTEVIRRTKQLGMVSLPGIISPSEAFQAIEAGADGLKLFPFEMITVNGLKALKAVLPPNVLLLPVGGIDSFNWQSLFLAGACGFGIGSSLFKPGISLDNFQQNTLAFKSSWEVFQLQTT